jgi:hypothetical protein
MSQEIADLNDSFIGQRRSLNFDRSGIGFHRIAPLVLTARRRTAWHWRFWRGKYFQIKLLIKLCQIALCGGGQKFVGQRGQDAVIAGTGQQMTEVGLQFHAAGMFSGMCQ